MQPRSQFNALPHTLREAEKALRSLISKGQDDVNLEAVMNILQNFRSVKITKFKNVNLILAVVRQDSISFSYVVRYFIGKNGLIEQGLENIEGFREYINQPNSLGFSALSYATYFEFEDLALRLIELGANYRHINNDGDSILMLAAKGGSLKVLMKLNQLGLDLKERKNGNLTLFHFACFEGNLHILKYLLKIDDLDGGTRQAVQQADMMSGETPLHMAVNSGEYSVVKYLLINKANEHATCNLGLTPLAKAKALLENGQLEKNKAEGIISLLGNIPISNRLKLQTRIGPQDRMNRYARLLLAINILGLVGSFFVIPYADQSLVIFPMYLCLQLVSFSFLWATRSNPGFIQRFGEKDYRSRDSFRDVSPKEIFLYNFSQLMKYKEYDDLCVECCIVKPIRSKHCDFCRKCVSVMDHHCPFVGNCIGSKNHKYFFMMLITQVLSQLFILNICAMFFFEIYDNHIDDSFSNYLLNNYGKIFVYRVAVGCVCVLLLQFIITAFPLFFILSHQIKIVGCGLTTMEMRYKSLFGTQKPQEDFDTVAPVTEQPLRTKSKQYQEYTTQPGMMIVATPDGTEQQISMTSSTTKSTSRSLTNSDLTEAVSAISKQQQISQTQLKEKRIFQNILDILVRNAHNPLYFGSDHFHSQLFLGLKPLSQVSQSSIADDISVSEVLINGSSEQ